MAVEFNEEELNQSTPERQEGHGVLTNLVFKLGLAKNPSQANLLMLMIAIVAIVLTIFLSLPSNRGPVTDYRTPSHIPSSETGSNFVAP